MKDFLNKIGSIRWTISILLLLAGVGALGTFLPRGQSVEDAGKMADQAASKALKILDFVDFFQSMWLRVLLVLLAVNIIACVIIRIPAVISAVRGQTAVRRDPVLVLEATGESRSRLVRSLNSMGFRNRGRGDTGLYSKGTAGYILTLLAHASLLVVMVSSLAGSIFGFVATKRISIGGISSTAYNWKTEKDMKLPFDVRPNNMVILPHAVSLRLGIVDIESNTRGGVVNSFEGGTFRVSGLPGSVTLERFDIDTRQFSAVWTDPNGNRTSFGRGSEIGGSGIALVPVAYATWPERQVLVKTELLLDSRIVRAGEISVNHPLSHDGVTIYLTDYGKDQFGFPYAGFQFVNDPGRVGVWTGCVIFIVALTGALFIRHSCVVIKEEEGVLKVYLSSMGDREGTARALRTRVIRDTGIDGEAAS